MNKTDELAIKFRALKRKEETLSEEKKVLRNELATLIGYDREAMEYGAKTVQGDEKEISITYSPIESVEALVGIAFCREHQIPLEDVFCVGIKPSKEKEQELEDDEYGELTSLIKVEERLPSIFISPKKTKKRGTK